MQAYLAVAPCVAGFPEYLEPLAWHLLRAKATAHWEKGLRELAAQALAGAPPRPPLLHRLARLLLGSGRAAACSRRRRVRRRTALLLACLPAYISAHRWSAARIGRLRAHRCRPPTERLSPPASPHPPPPWRRPSRPPPTRPPAALVPHRPTFFVDQALPFLLPLCTDPVLEARHGAVAALAELLPALRWGLTAGGHGQRDA